MGRNDGRTCSSIGAAKDARRWLLVSRFKALYGREIGLRRYIERLRRLCSIQVHSFLFVD